MTGDTEASPPGAPPEAIFGGDGHDDRLATVSETVSGADCYAPSRETLQSLGLAG